MHAQRAELRRRPAAIVIDNGQRRRVTQMFGDWPGIRDNLGKDQRVLGLQQSPHARGEVFSGNDPVGRWPIPFLPLGFVTAMGQLRR